jgi:hypothetical protein
VIGEAFSAAAATARRSAARPGHRRFPDPHTGENSMADQSDEIDFKSLKPELRAIALVGRYLQLFSFMENEIDDAIGKFLKLENMQMYVLSPNVPFLNKMHILRTLLSISFLTDTRKKHYMSMLNEVMGQSTPRNVIAHSAFAESKETDGVIFLVTRAQGEVKFIETDWSIARFTSEFDKLYKLNDQIEEMKNAITNLNMNVAALAAVMTMPTGEPNFLFSGLGTLGAA